MGIAARFIADNALGVYLIAAIGLLFYVRSYLLARRDNQSAFYGLERESARNRQYRALALVIFFTAIIVATYMLRAYGSEFLPPLPVISAPSTPGLLLTIDPTSIPTATTQPLPLPGPISVVSPAVGTATATPHGTATSKPTLTGTPVTSTPEISPTQPAPPPAVAGCGNPHATLTAPTNGSQVRDVVTLYGSADIDDFSFYKFELSGPFTNHQWTTIQVYRAPVTSGALGTWDASSIAASHPGTYSLRLVVVDRSGNYPDPCTITIEIASPAP